MNLTPYLNFDGTCEEAMNFYKDCLGGKIEGVNYFKDGPKDMPVPDHLKNRVMHMTVRFGDNVIMASDTMEACPPAGNISLSLNFDDSSTVDGLFEKLSAGGNVTMPLQDTFWGARFGMFTDKYGINWMLNAAAAPAGAASE